MNCRSPLTASLAAVVLLMTSRGSGAETPAAAGTGVAEASGNYGPATLILMSELQYSIAIAQIFGSDIKNLTRLPPLRRTDGLVALGAGTALVTSGALDVFEQSARSIAAQVVDPAHRDFLIPCKPVDLHQPDDACARLYLGTVGRLLFRRPLAPQELDTHVAAARTAGDKLRDFYSGLSYALAGMLVAPQFIYFVEDAEPDPQHPGQVRLDAFSKATRLSLLLWNSPPDDELLRAAESGDIHSSLGLKRQVDRMLASPRVKTGVRAFFEDMLNLEEFDVLTKDATIYPAYTQMVAKQAKEQTLRIIEDHLVTRNGDYRDLFLTRHTFITADLGAIYHVPVPSAEALEWLPYEVPDGDPRVGILTQVGFLSAHAHPGRSSATRRGKALREIFMCQRVPDPPPNVDFSAFENPNNAAPTTRQRLASHAQNPICAGCHKITDPIGLALENFDGAGQYRATEKNAMIDASGSLDGKSFADGQGLGTVLHDNPVLTSCLVKRVYQYGVHRPVGTHDKPFVAELEKQFSEHDYRFVELLRSLATDDAFYRLDADAVVHASLAQ
jgi:hypothetical protein